MQLGTLVSYLDRELDIGRFTDDSHNGLQVANSGRVTRVCLGVDATLPFFEKAAACGADLAICHHGLSWGDSLKRLTGLNYRLISFLMRHDLALWACHLPLDAHPRLGNNARLAMALKLRERQPAFAYHGQTIGVRGVLPRPMTFKAFRDCVTQVVGQDVRALDFGKPVVRTVGIVSGGAPSQIGEAIGMGLDVYVTGESNLHAYNLASQEGINAVFAGHYATETFGVQAVGDQIRRRFKLPVSFADMGIGY
jgi:dinuclear metal center YbgI/SA1388 family protein